MFRVALETTYSGSRLEYMWSLYSPGGTIVCYSSLYELANEALANAEAFVRAFNNPGAPCQLDIKTVENITGQTKVPNIAPIRPVERKFGIIEGGKEGE